MEVLGKNATKTSKNVSTRERLSVTIRLLQSFYSTALFCNMYNYARYTAFFHIEEYGRIYSENKEILSVTGISVQA